MKLTRLRGFQDLTGAQARRLSFIEERARAVAERYAVNEIRVPALERIALYQRSTGDTTDIVEKQMYEVARSDDEPGEERMVLRPEGTPGVVRAYIEAGLDRSDPEQRFFYSGPMFRYERPQKGRYREFYQFGVEVFGRADPACDAEVLLMIDDLRRELGVELKFELNSLGCAACRPRFRQAVLEYGRSRLSELCADCHARLERNPLRLLDCKIDVRMAASAPLGLDYLCEDCRKHFDAVRELSAEGGVRFEVNPRIVRGLDYYMRTTFEVSATGLGAQSAVVAGGRYDGLVEALGGAPVPGIGFAMGLERMALALGSLCEPGTAATTAIIALGAAATSRAMALARELRAGNARVELLSPERGLKAQLRRADRLGARYAVIIGDQELARGVAQVRDLRASTQREVEVERLAAALAADAS